MDFTPQPITNRQGLEPSFIYKRKSIILWLNSTYHSSSVYLNNKYYELTFDIPQITLFNTTKLKVVSYIHQATSAKQMIIRIKNLLYDGLCSHPLNYPILYVANTSVESQLENNEYSLSLLPQTINSITLLLDNQFITNFNGLNADFYQAPDPNVIRNGSVLNPVVWYKFDNSTNLGLDVYNTHNLTNNNGVAYNSTNYKRGGGSATFNGNNSSLRKLSSPYNLNSKDFSISFWSYRTNATAGVDNKYFFTYYGDFFAGSNTQITLSRAPSNYFSLVFGVNNYNYFGSQLSYLNTWLFITITYNFSSKIVNLYLNGTSVFNTYMPTAISATNPSFTIGATSINTYAFQGQIEDFRIYNTPLTATEITNLYNAYNSASDYYSMPPFVLGLAIEDADMEVYDSVSPHK